MSDPIREAYDARRLLMQRLNAILDDRWPLAGKIMAAVDEYAEARSTPAEAASLDCKELGEAYVECQRLLIEARSTPAEALALRAALERLLAVAMTEEEDVSAATQDEWIAAIQQANEALDQ